MADLTTRISVKAVLGIPSSVTQHDELIDILIGVADEEVLGFCGVSTIVQQTITEKFDISDSSVDQVMLSSFPVQSITSVTSGDSSITTDEYYVDLKTGKIKLKSVGGSFDVGRQTVTVVYVAGFSSIPADLKHAATLIAATHFNVNRLSGLHSQQSGAYRVTVKNDGLPNEALRILARYKRVFLG